MSCIPEMLKKFFGIRNLKNKFSDKYICTKKLEKRFLKYKLCIEKLVFQ